MTKFLKQYYVMLLIVLLLCAGGIYSYTKLNVSLFPSLDYPLVNIITHVPGMSSNDVEKLITNPIESQVGSLVNIKRTSSVSRQGLSEISVQFNLRVSRQEARTLIISALAQVQNKLPIHTHPAIEQLGSNLLNIVTYGVTYNKKYTAVVKNFCKFRLANIIKSINGVNRVSVIGGKIPAFIVSLNQTKLIQNHLSVKQVRTAISNNNIQMLEGYQDKYHLAYALSGDGRIKNIANLQNIPIKPNLFLKNIAHVYYGFEPKRFNVHINTKPGIAIMVYKNLGADTISVVSKIDKKLKSISNIYPPSMKIVKVYDISQLLKHSSSSLRDDIIIGIALVFIMLVLFLGSFESSVFVALSVPVITIITLIFMNIFHLSLNMITIGAMAVAIGMVVDDSIIILENIMRHRDMGKNSFQAAVDGTKEIAFSDISGTLTTVAAFFPFLFLGSLGGIFTTPFGVVISTMLLLSLIISLTVIPAYMAHRQNSVQKKPMAYKFIIFIQNISVYLLHKFLHYKKTVIGLSIVFFLISAVLLLFLPISFLPKFDEGAILVEYHTKPGTSLKDSNQIGNLIERIAAKNKNVYSIYRRTGSQGGTFGVEPVDQGEIIIDLKQKRDKSIFYIMKTFKRQFKKIPGIITIVHQVTAEKLDESMDGMPTMFALVIYGQNYHKLTILADKISKIAQHTPGVDTVYNSAKYKVPQLIIKPKRIALARYSINSRYLLKSVRVHLLGMRVGDVIKNQTIIPIYMQTKPLLSISKTYIKNIMIKTDKGYIPLKKLASISIQNNTSKIEHINMQRVVTLPMDVGANIKSIIHHIFNKIDAMHLPSGYFVTFAGQYKSIINMGISFAFLSLIGAMLIFIILSIQLGNLRYPFVILLNIPLIFSGAFMAMFITHSELNISFFIGLITLMGVGINHSIVLITYINNYKKDGLNKIDATINAVKTRTRPILLTVLTAIIAMLPVAIGIGVGSKIEQSLAICVIGGLLTDLFFTLTVMPMLFLIFDKKD